MSTNEANLLGQFIPLHYHYQMLLDQARMDGFKRAIERAVPPGGKVCELGGGTGVLSFFAAAKAAKVYCVEFNPQMAAAAKTFLAKNGCAEKVEVIEADAREYVPPEPVDVVICEMFHSALLREKQIEVIDAFKRNYSARHPGKLPIFIPEATILAVQPLAQNFTFYGYQAPLPMFFEPTRSQALSRELGDPQIYSMIQFKAALPTQFEAKLQFTFSTGGECNALRFITKNILLVLLEEKATIDWHNFYLILPLATPIQAAPGKNMSVSFSYKPGESIDSLVASLKVLEV